MDLRSCNHIVTLAKRLSYTRAADELGITQPALSRSIQTIEELSKVKLFDRDRGGVRVTILGEAIVAAASEVLRQSAVLEDAITRAATGRQEKVSFGMAPFPSATLLHSALAEEMLCHPELRFSVAVRDSSVLLNMLLEGAIEFFVSGDHRLPIGAPVRGSFIGRFASASFLVRSGHPLLSSERQYELDEFPWIIRAEFASSWSPQRGILSRLKQGPHLVIEDHGCLARLTQETDAIWVCSPHAAAAELRDNRLRVISGPVDDASTHIKVKLYSRERHTLSPAALRLLHHFRKAGAALHLAEPTGIDEVHN